MSEKIHDMRLGWNSLAAEMLYITMAGGPLAESLDFLERRIKENGGLTLDLTCGTGRHLIPLLERGLIVHGLDNSSDALHFAEEEARAKGVDPIIYNQNMEECSLPDRYGTIFIASGTFQIIVDRQQAILILRRLWSHLNPGGQLLIALFIPPEVSQGPSCNDSDHPIIWGPVPRRDANGTITTTNWSESVDLFQQALFSKRRYDLIVDGEHVKSEIHTYPLRWFFYHEFVMMLEQAGYEDIVTYHEHTDRPATQDSKLVHYGARRPRVS